MQSQPSGSTSELPIVIDLEASGFGRGSYPIEIGFVLSDSETHCTLVKPEDEWTHWDVSSQALHGIDRALLLSKGRPVREVAQWLNQNLAGKTVYSDAWGHDMTWLALLFDSAEVPQRFRLEALSKLLSEDQKSAWQLTRDQVQRTLSLKRHRASADARIIQLTYQRLANDITSSLNCPV